MRETRTHRVYDWIGRHARLVTIAMLLTVVAIGIAGPIVADTSEPNFDPSGEVFDVADRAQSTLQSESTIAQATFLVEASSGGDVLTANAFREWSEASDRVRTSASDHLVDRFDADTRTTIPGVLSIVDVVAASIPGGLENATDADVKAAVGAVLAPDSPYADMRFGLSEAATSHTGPGGIPAWSAPAFTTSVAYDEATFDGQTAEELWLRDVQTEFRSGAVHTDSIGIAIDGDTTFSEAIEQSAPFIFLAVAMIILLIAVVHRSYWSAVLVAVGLSATTLAYYGTSALIGLKMGSLLLAFIVPIAMISFGVDFFIHGVGRVREMQVEEGHGPRRAYAAGMAAVFVAMLLAASSSIAAFLANAASGTEAIVEFGIGAAIALGWAYLILGQVAPRVLVGIENFVGSNPEKAAGRLLYAGAMVIVAILGGLAVALAAAMPQLGIAAFGVIVVTLVLVPVVLTRRRNRRAATRGRPLQSGFKGSAHGLRPVGAVVYWLARWRIVTIPVVVMIGVLGLVTALSVKSGFELTDFLSANTSFVQSIDRTEAHFPSSGEGSSFIFIEGDLTDQQTLVAVDGAVARIDASDADFGRNGGDELIVGLHAADLVRMTMASPDAVAEIEAAGFSLTDADGNGLPDAGAGIEAIYDRIAVDGVPTPDGAVAIPAAEAAGILAEVGDGRQATAIVVQIGSFTDGAIIVPARATLEDVAAALEAEAPGLTTGVSGDVITQYVSLESFTRSMLVSLPLAILLTLVIASVLLRSFRYALVAVIPIGFVVTGVYAFMTLADYRVNVVTATIAAIAVGVGIDFSTHLTARYREEFANNGSRLAAVRRAGEGTGGALVLSAMTSVLGFLVMAMAPTPIFATFGLLTAVMIALALIVALVVLPSLLIVATPKPTPAATADDDLADEGVLVGI